MSAAASGLEEPPTVENFVNEGGRPASEERATGTSAVEGQSWSEEEWRQWNQWRWGWGGQGSNWFSSWGASEARDGERTAQNGAAVAAGGPSVDSRAVDPLWETDPWASGGFSWQSARGNEKWWGSTTKGDYADPPSWPGWSHYRLWRRALVRWNSNTDVALYRRAEKVLKNLEWEMQAKLDHLSEEILSSSNYLTAIFGVLDVLAGEREDSEKRRAIRAALYEGNRKSDDSLAQYALRRESQFSSVSKYLNLPDELKAVMLEEQSGLTKQGTQNLRVLTGGQHDYARVRKALQVLDTEEESLFKTGKNSFLATEEIYGDSGSETDDDMIDEDIFLAISEKDMDEEEALVFLAQNSSKRRTWSENKQLKAARKKDRRHFDDRSSRPERPATHRRLPVSELKKVTRCSNCGEKGHWKEECDRPYRSRSAREKQEKSQGNAFVFLGTSSSSEFKGSFLSLQSLAEDANLSFLALPDGHAVIDPGASQDLIGLESFDRLMRVLAKNGLKPVKLKEVPHPASGVGGDAKPLFNALVPCVLGGKPGIVKMTVVQENIPQLLSVGLLEHAGAVIDVAQNRIDFKNLGSSVDMIRLWSGHRIIDVASWSGKSFPVPDQLKTEYQLQSGAFDHSNVAACESYMLRHDHAVGEGVVLTREQLSSMSSTAEGCSEWSETGVGIVKVTRELHDVSRGRDLCCQSPDVFSF